MRDLPKTRQSKFKLRILFSAWLLLAAVYQGNKLSSPTFSNALLYNMVVDVTARVERS